MIPGPVGKEQGPLLMQLRRVAMKSYAPSSVMVPFAVLLSGLEHPELMPTWMWVSHNSHCTRPSSGKQQEPRQQLKYIYGYVNLVGVSLKMPVNKQS